MQLWQGEYPLKFPSSLINMRPCLFWKIIHKFIYLLFKHPYLQNTALSHLYHCLLFFHLKFYYDESSIYIKHDVDTFYITVPCFLIHSIAPYYLAPYHIFSHLILNTWNVLHLIFYHINKWGIRNDNINVGYILLLFKGDVTPIPIKYFNWFNVCIS